MTKATAPTGSRIAPSSQAIRLRNKPASSRGGSTRKCEKQHGGSGKSASVILTFLSALVQAPPDRVSASLVIDPKHEIGPVLDRLAPDRVHRLRPRDLGLVLMGGPRWSIDADLAAGRWRSAATKIMIRVAAFAPTSPARVLLDHQFTGSNAEFFDREGTDFLVTVLAFVLMLTHPSAPPADEWLDDDPDVHQWLQDFLGQSKGPCGARGPNALALAAYVLQGPLVELSPDDASGGWLFTRLARAASYVWGRDSSEARQLVDRVLHYWKRMADIDRQYAGVLATARAACSDFADPHVASTLYVGCEPGARGLGAGACDFARVVSPDCDGRVLLFQPSRDGLDILTTKVLKAKFFEAVFDDPVRASGAPDLPLLAYVADEFHQFVTSGALHGEASILDRCRSYGVSCVLACQSVASIEHAFAHGGGTYEQDRTAASILWTNTASKFVFRSGDPTTARRVDELCPYRPGLALVTQVRPLSTLSPGECYAALADGRFERRQLEPVLTHGVERAPSARRSRSQRAIET